MIDDKLFICEDHSGLLELLGESAADDGMPYAASKWKRVEVVDRSLLLHPNPTKDEEHQHAERMATHWLAKYERLSGEVALVPRVARDDPEKMREVIEAMRPIVDAAIDWHKWVNHLEPDTKPSRAHVLDGIIGDQCKRAVAAMSAWQDSQTLSEAERMRPVVAAVAVWAQMASSSACASAGCDRIIDAYDAYRAGGGRKHMPANHGGDE